MDTLLMEMASNIKAILVKQDDMQNDIAYLSGLKNKHEERISNVEKRIPDNLDLRLREIEINIKQNVFIISIFVAIVVSILTKIFTDFVG